MKKHKKGNFRNWLIPGLIVTVLVLGILFLVKVFLTPDSGRRRNQVAVTLLKPPPPPEQKEKPPEPEPPKETPKENIATPTNEAPQQNQQDDSPPPGQDLGVDAEGGAGGDGFGLVGKKGGRAITLGGGGGGNGVNRLSLLTKYGSYISKIQGEVKQRMHKQLDQEGGSPKGKYQATVHLLLDGQGVILKFRIIDSSGNDKIDDAIKVALSGLRISQPPPEGMPRTMTVRISSQG